MQFFLDFFRNFRVYTYIQVSFMCVCKYLKSKKNRRIEWKIFQGFFKNKKEKKHMKRLRFITQFKIEFLLPFTSCRKVLRKMPDGCVCFSVKHHRSREMVEVKLNVCFWNTFPLLCLTATTVTKMFMKSFQE